MEQMIHSDNACFISRSKNRSFHIPLLINRNSFFSVQISENQGPVEVVTAGQNMAAPPKSPMIFVVPNSGQKQQVSIRQVLERLSKS